MRGLTTTLRSLAVASLMIAGTASAMAQETVLKAVTYIPPTKVEDSMAVFKAWIDKVNEVGKGQIRIEILGGPDVFPVADQFNALSKGLVDIAMTFTAHAGIVPEIDTTGLSDITPSEEREVGYFQLLDEAHNKFNVKLIGRTATNSGFYIFSKDPINKLADFANVKIRSHSGYDGFFKKLGANPIGMNISEIYGGLERSIVTAAPYNIFAYDLGLQEVTKYVLGDAFWPSHTTVTLMNLKKFNALTPEQQKILLDAQLEVEAGMADMVATMAATERQRLEGAGMTFTHLPPDEAKQWRRMANDSRFEVLGETVGQEQLDKIKSMIVRD